MKPITLSELTATQREKIVTFLTARPVGVLATVDRSGDPNASAIYFTIDKELHLTFTTKQGTHKYENITHHPQVMLVVFDAETQTSVQISGRAVEAMNGDDQQAIYQGTLYAAAQTGSDVVPPIAKIVAGSYAGFFIQISTILLSEYGWGDTFAHSMKHARDANAGGDPA